MEGRGGERHESQDTRLGHDQQTEGLGRGLCLSSQNPPSIRSASLLPPAHIHRAARGSFVTSPPELKIPSTRRPTAPASSADLALLPSPGHSSRVQLLGVRIGGKGRGTREGFPPSAPPLFPLTD